MSAVRMRVVDNTRYFLRGKNEAVNSILDDIGKLAVKYAQELVPQPGKSRGYAQGDLHDSIGYDRVEKAVRIYASMPYAAYVEVGTKYQTAQPFLRPAVENHSEEYKEIAISIFRGGSARHYKYQYYDD